MAETDIVRCLLCDTPNRRGTVSCDDCDQPLDALIDPNILQDELAGLRTPIALALAGVVAMIVINWLLFGGAGYIIAIAPLGWFGHSVIRYRVVSRALHLHAQRKRSSEQR
jgi:hypothetical protein